MLYPRIFFATAWFFFSTSKVSEFVGIFCRDWCRMVPPGPSSATTVRHLVVSLWSRRTKQDMEKPLRCHGKTDVIIDDNCDMIWLEFKIVMCLCVRVCLQSEASSMAKSRASAKPKVWTWAFGQFIVEYFVWANAFSCSIMRLAFHLHSDHSCPVFDPMFLGYGFISCEKVWNLLRRLAIPCYSRCYSCCYSCSTVSLRQPCNGS